MDVDDCGEPRMCAEVTAGRESGEEMKWNRRLEKDEEVENVKQGLHFVVHG